MGCCGCCGSNDLILGIILKITYGIQKAICANNNVTIIIALLATIISTIIGTITAIGLSKSKKVLRAFVSQVNDFPIMNPEIVTAIGLMLLFITFQIEKGFVTLLLAHIAFCIPSYRGF